MSDEDNDNGGQGWLERLSQAFAGEPRDREELIEVLRDAAERGIIDEGTLAMLSGVFAVGQMQVRDIMVPRAQMVVVEHDATLEELLPIVIESGHSRFPVIGESRDEVIGLLLAKDLLRHVGHEDPSEFKVTGFLRPAVHIPESKRLDVLLTEFRESRSHIAMVMDEYGGVAGLITIEDVLEQIVGDIDDEFDVDEGEQITEHGERRYSVAALLSIEQFNEYFGSRFSDEQFDTVGGLVVHELGHVPRVGERVAIGAFDFRILRADRRRVQLLEIRTAPENDAAKPAAHDH
ncbi:MAG: CBS domain-containing protein [Gammaproteobacteria bacterium]|nr:CBS domain-containing protein [Gammaproteobacteria bacterium]